MSPLHLGPSGLLLDDHSGLLPIPLISNSDRCPSSFDDTENREEESKCEEGDATPTINAKTVTAPAHRTAFRQHVFSRVPVYATRLERLIEIDVGDFEQCETPDLLAHLLRSYFENRDREEFVVVLFNASMRVLGLVQVSVGGLSRTIVEPAQVFKAAILTGAHALVLAHNHPSGGREPSDDDVEITQQLVACGKLLGVEVFDHLIVTGQHHVSLAQRGLLPKPS